MPPTTTARATLALLGALPALACTPPPPPTQPDVYLIAVDTLRADHLGLYGYGEPVSPRLDAFAQQAVVFDRAYTAAPWTLPSFATMLTGHHARALGIHDRPVRLDESVRTLPELYREAGYGTGAVVSHIYLQKDHGLMQGIERYDDAEVGDSHVRISSEGVTDRALDMIDQHLDDSPEKPLFLLVHYFDPHEDYFLHPELYDTYPDYVGPLSSGVNCEDMRHNLRKDPELRAQDLRSLKNLYDSEIKYTDLHIGRLLDGIQKTGRADSSLIVIVADHGEELGTRETGWIGHTKVVTEEVLHVPLLIKPPHGLRPRARVPEPVSLVDLMPTMAALSGLSLPPEVQPFGRALNLASPEGNRSVVHAETGRWTHIRVAIQGQEKLVLWNPDHLPLPALFDLGLDPGETDSVAAERPERVLALRAELDAWNDAIALDRARLNPGSVLPALSPQEEEALRAMGYIQ